MCGVPRGSVSNNADFVYFMNKTFIFVGSVVPFPAYPLLMTLYAQVPYPM